MGGMSVNLVEVLAAGRGGRDGVDRRTDLSWTACVSSLRLSATVVACGLWNENTAAPRMTWQRRTFLEDGRELA